jgi:uncharacterized glyoxalase superfamily protein PhnB
MNLARISALTLALLLGTAIAIGDRPAAGQEKLQERIMLKKLTPVLIVEEIEPCLPFWVDRLGFQKTAEVPEGNKLGFVILAKDSVQVMYQSRASLANDVPAFGNLKLTPSTFLYIEVEKLDPVIEKLRGAQVEIPERKTFYGAREIGVREPGGNHVTFAEFQR